MSNSQWTPNPNDKRQTFPNVFYPERFAERALPLNAPGGSGTYDGMDGWQMSVENRLQSVDGRLLGLDKKIEGNFKTTWAGLIIGFLVTWGGLIAGFLWIADRLPPSQ